MDADMYYYSDAIFQLEINLHKVRKELISMLELCEETDCSKCYQLKCKCVKKTKTESVKSDTDKVKPTSDTNEDDKSKAPNALSLPKPIWTDQESPAPSTPEKDKEIQQDIEAWIDASSKIKDADNISIIKGTSLLSINDNLLLLDKKKTPQVAINYVNNGNAVEAFFKYFKMPSNTAVTYVSAKLAAASTKPVKQNYSYF